MLTAFPQTLEQDFGGPRLRGRRRKRERGEEREWGGPTKGKFASLGLGIDAHDSLACQIIMPSVVTSYKKSIRRMRLL